MEIAPRPTKNAIEVARLTTGVAAEFLGLIIPGASILGPIAGFAIDKFVRKPESILKEEILSSDICIEDPKISAEFIPVLHKYFDVARNGEYEHNLRLLAKFIRKELELGDIDASRFSRLSRRIEGLSEFELRLMAIIQTYTESDGYNLRSLPGGLKYISSQRLWNFSEEMKKYPTNKFQLGLSELSSRGFLLADGSSRMDKHEEYFFVTENFSDLIARANVTELVTI